VPLGYSHGPFVSCRASPGAIFVVLCNARLLTGHETSSNPASCEESGSAPFHSAYFVLAWLHRITAGSFVSTVVLYKLRFRRACAIVSSMGLVSLVLMAWVYFNLW
jgi:hypothetical protein